MIGQVTLTNKITAQIERNKFPRFVILIGEKGSGKKTLANYIGERLNAVKVTTDIKVDTVREVIEMSYKTTDTTAYIIPDCDNMSSQAANALLKITEEPPHNAYFILTCENLENILPTIKSRAVTYMLEPYTYYEKLDYIAVSEREWSDDEIEALTDISANLGDLSMLMNLNLNEFTDYVNLVIDNIAEVSGSNAFKIGEKIALKDEADKYDLKLFWRAFSSICADRMRRSTDPVKYAHAIAITGDATQQLSIRGINKQMLFDSWLLDIREDWYDYN